MFTLCAALILECGEDAIIEVITELYLSKEISVLNVIFKLLVLVFISDYAIVSSKIWKIHTQIDARKEIF